jgi:hypothetical protein
MPEFPEITRLSAGKRFPHSDIETDLNGHLNGHLQGEPSKFTALEAGLPARHKLPRHEQGAPGSRSAAGR